MLYHLRVFTIMSIYDFSTAFALEFSGSNTQTFVLACSMINMSLCVSSTFDLGKVSGLERLQQFTEPPPWLSFWFRGRRPLCLSWGDSSEHVGRNFRITIWQQKG